MRTSLFVPVLLGGHLATLGCSRSPPAPASSDSAADSPSRVAMAPSPVPATSLDPCSILDVSDVRKVLRDAGAGVRDRGDESHGVMLCTWTSEGGRLTLQLHDSPPGAVAREIQERALGLVDLENDNAAAAVRVEVVSGVGDSTLALAEKADAARGVRRADAIVVTQKGFRVVAISAPALAAGDRAVALSSLKDLARAASDNL